MKFNSLNIGSLFGRCNNIFHRLTRFLKRALAVKKSERNETYRSNKHQRPRPHNRPRILNKIFIFRSAGRLFPLFLSKCRHLTNGNQRWLATGKSLHVSILLGRISVHCRTRKTNKRLLIFSLSFSCRLSLKKKKKKNRNKLHQNVEFNFRTSDLYRKRRIIAKNNCKTVYYCYFYIQGYKII